MFLRSPTLSIFFLGREVVLCFAELKKQTRQTKTGKETPLCQDHVMLL